MARPPSGLRGHILESARGLFAEHGFKGTSLHDIAVGADCSKSALLYHFAGKEAILTEVLTGPAEALTALGRTLGRLEGEEAQEAAVTGFVDLALSFSSEVKIIFAELPEMLGHPVLAVVPQAVDALATALAGGAHEPDAQIAAWMVIGGTAVTTAQYAHTEEGALRSSMVEGALRLLGHRSP